MPVIILRITLGHIQRTLDKLPQRNGNAELDQNFDNRIALPPQSERITRPCRLFTGSKACGEAVDFVGKRNHGSNQRPGTPRFDVLRKVVVVNRLGNLPRLALSSGVQSTHNPLQFCELLHHLRGQIALRKLRGTHHVLFLGAIHRPL